MGDYQAFGEQLRSFLVGMLGVTTPQASLAPTRVPPPSMYDDALARQRRRDPQFVPGSRHYASMLAFGDFITNDGTTIRCEAIPGISGVVTDADVALLKSGLQEVNLTRFLTHFYFENPSVVIEQNPKLRSTGTLTGAKQDSLLPGRASFSQFLILTLADRPLANREPLVMVADHVEEWPPVGSTFVSERPTEFFDLEQVDDPKAKPFAMLAACKAVIVAELRAPDA